MCDSLQYDNSKESIYGLRSNKTKGLLTGSRTYLLNEENSYIETAYYYDYLGRLIQKRSTNHFGGCDNEYIAYDFIGNTTRRNSTKSVANGQYIDEQYTYTYDHAGRLIQTNYQLNENPPMVMNRMRYDELGRLACKHIYDSIDSVKYSYNIRDQLTQIKSAGFEENLYYNTANPTVMSDLTWKCYNGNISSSTWTYNNQINGYLYYYDNQNRLSFTYSVINSEWADWLQTEIIQYGANSNITQIYRFNDEEITDWLFYNYNGNQLKSITDNFNMSIPSYNTKHYQDLADEEVEFEYDKNGNMTKDLDRRICKIEYNVLNLPTKIQFSNGDHTAHLYDARGNRISTTYYTRKATAAISVGNILEPEDSISNYYVTREGFNDNIVYQNIFDGWTTKYIKNPEGYIWDLTRNEFYPCYYIKDHIGNVRETWIYPWEGYKECIQRTQYYPSGLPWNVRYDASLQPYKYNGKEFVEMHGQDEYDSHARWYYPAVMRTITMDPLCEKYYDISPYAWCGNNPVNTIDPDGKWSVNVHGSANRAKYPYSLYQVVDNRGNIVFQTIVKTKGSHRIRSKTNGDTPNGKYRLNKWRKDIRFGENPFIDQTYEQGEGRGENTNKRDRMHTHGGGDKKDKSGNLIGLKGTYGCFRMSDDDLIKMKLITDVLEESSPAEKMTSLTFEDDIQYPISEDDFIEEYIGATLSNGTILLPEVIVRP